MILLTFAGLGRPKPITVLGGSWVVISRVIIMSRVLSLFKGTKPYF